MDKRENDIKIRIQQWMKNAAENASNAHREKEGVKAAYYEGVRQGYKDVLDLLS